MSDCNKLKFSNSNEDDLFSQKSGLTRNFFFPVNFKFINNYCGEFYFNYFYLFSDFCCVRHFEVFSVIVALLPVPDICRVPGTNPEKVEIISSKIRKNLENKFSRENYIIKLF